jgi:O-antigen/teichoic acid export membrane protein
LILTVPLGVICFCYGGYLMSILYGRSYMDAHWPFRVMSLVIPLCALRLTFTHPLLASHRQNVVAALAVNATLATALLSYVLFLAWGALGVAWAVVFGEAFFTVSAMLSARRLLSIHAFTSAWFPIGLAACMMMLAALVPVQPIIRIAISVGLFSMVILAFDDLAKTAAQIVLRSLVGHPLGQDTVL